MPYKERLSSWLVVRLLPNMQRVTVAQFRSRSDADGRNYHPRRFQACVKTPSQPSPK